MTSFFTSNLLEKSPLEIEKCRGIAKNLTVFSLNLHKNYNLKIFSTYATLCLARRNLPLIRVYVAKRATERIFIIIKTTLLKAILKGGKMRIKRQWPRFLQKKSLFKFNRFFVLTYHFLRHLKASSKQILLDRRSFKNMLSAKVFLSVVALNIQPTKNSEFYPNLNTSGIEFEALVLKNSLSYIEIGGHLAGIDYDLLADFKKTSSYSIRVKAFNSWPELMQYFKKNPKSFIASKMPEPFLHNESVRQIFSDTKAELSPALETTEWAMICKNQREFSETFNPGSKNIFVHDYIKESFGDPNNLGAFKKITKYTESAKTLAKTRILPYKDNCLITEKFEAQEIVRTYPELILVEPKQTQLFLNDNKFYTHWVFQKPETKKTKDLSEHFAHFKRRFDHWYMMSLRSSVFKKTKDLYRFHIGTINSKELLIFNKRQASQLPQYLDLFKEAATQVNLPWQLIAAVAYQESHWQEDAVSPTGVRGIMMLTQETAQFLGVIDRTDPRESILGGARYLRYLLNQTPNHLPFKERLSLTLAAYNVGPGHLEDAQEIALKLNKNPHNWMELKEVLPLLAEPEFYKDTRFGKARGREPVEYVRRVRNYFEILQARG